MNETESVGDVGTVADVKLVEEFGVWYEAFEVVSLAFDEAGIFASIMA